MKKKRRTKPSGGSHIMGREDYREEWKAKKVREGTWQETPPKKKGQNGEPSQS